MKNRKMNHFKRTLALLFAAVLAISSTATSAFAAKQKKELSLIEVACSIGARADLGRPTTTALENKENFMRYLAED